MNEKNKKLFQLIQYFFETAEELRTIQKELEEMKTSENPMPLK